MPSSDGLLKMSDDSLVQLEINDQPISANAGDLLIRVAEDNGIEIPRFCYHRKLSVAANCRMCLVEVENAPKPMPACATQVAEGMKVFTKSDKAIKAQKSVMEFLLINHPLDCPICDQGGECDLQDLSVKFGTDFSRYAEKKRIVNNKKLGSLVTTDMTRCIHCTRCVRFGKEIAGIVEMGGVGRGEHMEIDTYVEKSLSSELSGNIIDICPVGALTSKPFKFKARNWELTNTQSIAPHDALGSNVIVQTINNKVVRVLPDDNEEINEVWLSDRDRFSYLGLNVDRAMSPMIRNASGELENVDWEVALTTAASKIKQVIDNNPDSLGALTSANSTVEEMHLLQKMLRALGSNKIDYRLRQSDFTLGINQTAPGLSCKISDIENMDSILLVGFDVQKEVPLLAHRIRKAANKGATVNVLNPKDFDFSFNTTHTTGSWNEAKMTLEAIGTASLNQYPNNKYTKLKKVLGEVKSDVADQITQSLAHKKTVILMGQHALASNQFSYFYALSRAISDLTDSEFGLIDGGSNAAGAWATACVNPDSSLSGADLVNSVSGIILSGLELDQDSGEADKIIGALSKADFVLSLTSFMDDTSARHADVILPISAFSETSGTYINMQGDWQSFTGALAPKGEARPAWKVLRVLANKLDIGGFDFTSSLEVLAESQQQATQNTDTVDWDLPAQNNAKNQNMSVANIYASDALVRRSAPLQETVLADNREAT